mmetsp:Transcript_29023/g.78541  ORF Transcript_29023/g.78541 Transcript_29023/m.78541 type:complete len:260 (+) Transcript_29023:195-974(+)|eukprot:CAMPEP_0172379974 /NCGR_PEP_ID=MMETSP1060-20121228/70200_1 /TAXON_ID=37318 /ORGANISM="Pseudo-nitzschia pungens, Strain cf. cingulata" /LENGTH=259 /DNA_ID=CAMNT_0013107719 /DNA_START=1156 /DNA_END=1935 /DNA_ORIENTATION=+
MLPIVAVALISLASNSDAFSGTRSPIPRNDRHLHRQQRTRSNSPCVLFSGFGGDEDTGIQENLEIAGNKNEGGHDVKALGPATSSKNIADDAEQIDGVPLTEADTASTQVFMITREMKRTMVEELGYKRKDVDSIRIELVANIIENRVRCPSEGMPTDWIDLERESINQSIEAETSNSSMMKRLENESKYPLKFPLLAVSLILFGKGFSDALITLIKVNIGFPGASLTDQFQGIPVLAIDVVCVIIGAGIGLWTWKTMK